MTSEELAAARDVTEEVNFLIATLHDAERRLEELTFGEVDTVVDSTGRTFVFSRAQEQLRRSEYTRQAGILNALPAHIALLDEAGAIVSVNDTWRRFASTNSMQNPTAGVGGNYLAICDDAIGEGSDEAHQVAAGIRAVLNGELETFSIEYLLPPAGEERWFLLTVSPLSDNHSGAIVMHQDITQRREGEKILLESEERFSGAFEQAPIGVALVSPDGLRWLRVNRALCALFGYSETELLTRTIHDLTHPDDVRLSAENVKRAVNGGPHSFQIEKRYIDKGGKVITALLSTSLVRDALGVALYFVTHIEDVTERRLAENELRESHQNFHQLANNISDAFWIRSPDMREVHYISSAFERIWGRSRETLYSNPDQWSTFIVPEDRERVRATFAELTGDRPSLDIEYRIVRPDGEIRWVRARGFQVRDSAGTLIRNIGSITDITDRQRATEELKASEEEQRQLANDLAIERSRLLVAQQVAKVGSWDADLATTSIAWSEEVRRIFEADADATGIDRHDFLAAVHPDDRHMVDEAFRKSFLHSAACSVEHRLLFPDGRIKFIEERWQITFDADTITPIRATGTCQDITERKLGEIALRQSQERLRGLIDGLGPTMFVALLTPDGELVEINRSPLEAAGLKAEDVLGKPFPETYWWTHSPSAQLQLHEAIARASRGEASRYDVRIRGSENKIIDIDFSLQPLRDESGNVVFLIPSASVITERKLAESALRQAQKMEAVGRLAAGVAHEFNNILQTLMSMAVITRMRAVSPEIVKIAGEMEAQIRRGASVTRQLLLSSRHQDSAKMAFDLREQVANARDLLRRLLPENIELVVEMADHRASVEGDPGQIQQVLLNLAINARDAMPDGGTLTLRVARDGAEVTLEVEDDGAGMDEVTREHLFEPFFTTKDVGEGTGLGLAVVYGIVEQHGGRIEVESHKDLGSVFRVILPEAGYEPERIEAPPQLVIARASGRILLVEDEEGVREGLEALLDMLGYDVIAVCRGEDAIALPPTPAPDLLLSDVSLPGIGGPELAARLRMRWPTLKVTLMTGYLDANTRDRARDQGWDVLQKPFEMADLSQHLANAFREGDESLDTLVRPDRRDLHPVGS